MCLFPRPNPFVDSIAYKKGITTFDCGGCPECLSVRSNRIALKCMAESQLHVSNLMCTLTYDQFERDGAGRIIGEKPVDRTRHVCVRDVQLFLKRLRKWCDKRGLRNIKYYVCSEYGKRTGRAHYHILLFGVSFSDMFFYKKSKRGNLIYMSETLTKLWRNGICTIDSKNLNGSIARYCSKYAAKDYGVNDTFSLMSHHLGMQYFLSNFNGLYYIFDGVKYPVPRQVWEEVIQTRYQNEFRFRHRPFTYRYVSAPHCNYFDTGALEDSYLDDIALQKREENIRQRRRYRNIRDHDPQYVRYLEYWHDIVERKNKYRPDVLTRINQLDQRKYGVYKAEALFCYNLMRRGMPFYIPRSKAIFGTNGSQYLAFWFPDYFEKLRNNVKLVSKLSDFDEFYHDKILMPLLRAKYHLPLPSRLIRANDTFLQSLKRKPFVPLVDVSQLQQLSLF